VSDILIERYVDEQRAHTWWLLKQMRPDESPRMLPQKSLYCAAVRASHCALTGYFAELTQKRFQASLWNQLHACLGSFMAMQKVTASGRSNIERWLQLEMQRESTYVKLLGAIAEVFYPNAQDYRSLLLTNASKPGEAAAHTHSDNKIASDNSNSPAGSNPEPAINMIATTARAHALSGAEFESYWAAVDALILADRSLSLEC
jgi:hypothetical protein